MASVDVSIFVNQQYFQIWKGIKWKTIAKNKFQCDLRFYVVVYFKQTTTITSLFAQGLFNNIKESIQQPQTSIAINPINAIEVEEE